MSFTLRAAKEGAEIQPILFSLKSKKYSDDPFNYNFLNLDEENVSVTYPLSSFLTKVGGANFV